MINFATASAAFTSASFASFATSSDSYSNPLRLEVLEGLPLTLLTGCLFDYQQ
jgi:hypothetical protein